jgi:hypothetical protein
MAIKQKTTSPKHLTKPLTICEKSLVSGLKTLKMTNSPGKRARRDILTRPKKPKNNFTFPDFSPTYGSHLMLGIAGSLAGKTPPGGTRRGGEIPCTPGLFRTQGNHQAAGIARDTESQCEQWKGRREKHRVGSFTNLSR